MKLQISKNANVNYLSKIVEIKEFIKHPDPKVERIKCAVVDGFIITVGIDSEPGKYVYFPVLAQINPNLLQYLNLYRDKEKNKDPEKTGYFENKGIVKAINLRGVKSEGFLMPLIDLQNFIVDQVNVELLEPEANIEFDEVEHDGKTFWISKKYVAPSKIEYKPGIPKWKKKKKGLNKIIDEQFRFHYDTVILKKCPHVIHPDDIIHISSKWHGTSGISAYVLCHKELTWKEKIAKWLTGYSFDTYDYVYSSRTVIKNPYYNNGVTEGYYGVDVWKYADGYIRPFLEKGMTIYYEIVGYLPNGGMIQKDYDYGCVPPVKVTDSEGNETVQYIQGRQFKVYVYRITLTNVDGKVHEFSSHEVQTWCKQRNLLPMIEYYYGYAFGLYPEIEVDDNWSIHFMTALANDKTFHMEENSPECTNKVPHEGIVIRKESMRSEAWKVKCFKFLGKEQDAALAGISNIEDNA